MTALCAFTELNRLIATARVLRDVESIAALEVVDGRAIALAAERLAPTPRAWRLGIAGRTRRRHRADRAVGRFTGRPEPGTGRRVDAATRQAVGSTRIRRRGGRDVRATTEIRCLVTAFGYSRVRLRLGCARRPACPWRPFRCFSATWAKATCI